MKASLTPIKKSCCVLVFLSNLRLQSPGSIMISNPYSISREMHEKTLQRTQTSSCFVYWFIVHIRYIADALGGRFPNTAVQMLNKTSQNSKKSHKTSPTFYGVFHLSAPVQFVTAAYCPFQ